jgi:hypothetical protein
MREFPNRGLSHRYARFSDMLIFPVSRVQRDVGHRATVIKWCIDRCWPPVRSLCVINFSRNRLTDILQTPLHRERPLLAEASYAQFWHERLKQH